MKRIAKIISFICLICAAMTALNVAGRLPVDSGRYVAKKYSGWSGVLRCWVYADWDCAGSFVSWLNGCAGEFEQAHEGVYLEFEPVDAAAIAAMDSLHPPDMILSSGPLPTAQLIPLAPAGLRCGLDDVGGGYGRPVAMGGYVRVENPSAAGFAIQPGHAGPMLAMWEAAPTAETEPGGIDLGLEVMAQATAIGISEDAFQRFMNGELGGTIVDQGQLAKLIALRDAGLGPDWRCRTGGRYAWVDQLLMLGVMQGEAEVQALCRDFADHLLTEACQGALGRIGAFPVTDATACNPFSAYRAMEAQLQGATLLIPRSEHCDGIAGALVREVTAGQLTAEAAIAELVQSCR